MSAKDSNRIFVGIGEVLFDVFEDGRQALGGAPLNLEALAHRMGAWVPSQPPATPMLPDSVIDYVRHATSARPAV